MTDAAPTADDLMRDPLAVSGGDYRKCQAVIPHSGGRRCLRPSFCVYARRDDDDPSVVLLIGFCAACDPILDGAMPPSEVDVLMVMRS